MAIIHEEYIRNYLDKNKEKSFIGSELYKILMRKFPTITEANCKNVLHRAVEKKLIISSNPITFENNQFAYYSIKSKTGYPILENSIRTHKASLHRIWFALGRNKGILSKYEACKIAGISPNATAHNISYNSLVDDLKTLNLADTITYNETEYIIYKNHSVDEIYSESFHKKQKSNNLLLYLSLQWLIRSNILDAKQLCYSGESNKYNGVLRNNEAWDAFGFSNAVSIRSKSKEFQTIALIDFMSEHQYEEYDFEGFKQRVERAVYSTKTKPRKVLPIVISKDFSPAAYSLIKKNGYLCFRLAELFGDNVYEVSRNYIRNTADIEYKIENGDSNILNEISNSLNDFRKSGNEGNYGNLKGTLFEYLMYPVIQKLYPGCLIQHSYSGKVDNKDFECDYLVTSADEFIIFELKGYKRNSQIQLGEFDPETKKYTPYTVLWFINQTFDLCSKKIGKEKPKKFCYITTADFDKAARDELLKRKKNKPNLIEPLYNYDTLMDLLKKLKMKNEAKVIKQFYS